MENSNNKISNEMAMRKNMGESKAIMVYVLLKAKNEEWQWQWKNMWRSLLEKMKRGEMENIKQNEKAWAMMTMKTSEGMEENRMKAEEKRYEWQYVWRKNIQRKWRINIMKWEKTEKGEY